MLVRESEACSGDGRPARRWRLRRAIRIALAAAALGMPAARAELPVPCIAGVCGSSATSWVSSGTASLTSVGANLTVNQTSPSAVLNWSSFNVGADNTVTFRQPSAAALAINRIFQADPSRIFGRVVANGQIYLINQNGILFGRGAQVDVGTLVASSLDITPSALVNGLASALTVDRQPAFVGATDADGNVLNGDVIVEQGASLTAANGGRILLFGPNVSNSGSITTPNGQAVLAAGTKVYLASSNDSDLRGLLVEVDVGEVTDLELQQFLAGETDTLPLGAAQNFGTISATTGNISMVGLAVNQLGRVSATTSVLANGTVSLRAADKQDPSQLIGGIASPTRGGRVTLGEGSVTEVNLDTASTEKTVDVNEQPRSAVSLAGASAHLLEDATVVATGGSVSIRAQANPSEGDAQLANAVANDSRVLIESGVRVDVSGANVELAADSQTIDVQLFAEQLKDSPLQRDGVLRGQTVTVDLRQSGVRDDGIEWIGTPLANVSGAAEGIQRTVAERNLDGGTIDIVSQGDVIVADGARLDVSGGRIDYAEGLVQTTQLRADGEVFDIAKADPDRVYDGIVGEASRKDPKWGQTQSWLTAESTLTYSPAYSEGRDAGTVAINAPRLILDGSVDGSVTQGDNQRLAATAPRGGTLAVGYLGSGAVPANYRSGSILFDERTILDALAIQGFDPRRDALPVEDAIVIRPSLFSVDGVAHGEIGSNESIVVPAGADIELPAGGSLVLNASDIEVAATISATGGNVALTAERTITHPEVTGHDVTLQPGAAIDVSGQWVNDSPVLGASPTSPVWIDGGSVTLSSPQGSVLVPDGASIDVSGSAWLRTDGSIVAGRGGSIGLSSGSAAGRVELGGTLTAYALQRGGSLSIATHSICISSADCGTLQAEELTLRLAPGMFQENGFSSYTLVGNIGGLVVAGDARVVLRQSNRVLEAGYETRATGADIDGFSHIELLPDHLRRPVSLSLTSLGNHPAELRVERGAIIDGDPGATLSLTARSRMYFDGTARTPGGIVRLSLLNNPANIDFVANEVLWLGADAVIDVGGASLLRPNALGLQLGTVRDGGQIVLGASRGYVVVEGGASLDASGTAAELDIQQSDGRYQRRIVRSDAGTISISAAEGAVLEGDLRAAAGGAGALGGTLNLTLNPNGRGERPSEVLQTNNFPHGPRVIEIVERIDTSVLDGTSYDTLDASFTARESGRAQVSAEALASGGFDSVALTSRTLLNRDTGEAEAAGVVRVAADLSLGRRLVVDAPSIEVAGPDVTISAPYVSLANTLATTQFTPAPVGGTNRLTVRGEWIDLVGSVSVSGAESVRLHSDSDVRLRAIPQLGLNDRTLTGLFSTAGELEIRSTQLYPTTLTDFSITVTDGAQGTAGRITLLPVEGPQGPVLSAGGSLRVNADIIDHRGVIKAPLGSIELNAADGAGGTGQLTLAAGSITSTSAAGVVIPVGRTEGGLDWTYDLGNQQKLVLSPELDGIPSQRIRLSGDAIDLAEGALIDVAAGGDLQAYEFVAGVGGSRDILSLAESSGSFAILPVFGETVAPFDHQESAGFGVAIGTTVHLLEGTAGLPAGEYAILPARYALLPGAYLISEQDGFADLLAGSRAALRDGTPVVAGVYGVAGTDQRDDRTRGFSVVSAEFLRNAENSRRPAEYRLSLATDFFPARLAAAEADGATRLPFDAGTLAIEASQSLGLQASLRGDAVEDGRGAAVDIVSDSLRIVADGDTAGGEGIPIEAGALNNLGAESIMLGALRTETEAGVELEVVSRDVTIAENARLQAPEIVLAAREVLTIENGATLAGQGRAVESAADYRVAGDSALLRVSAGSQASLERTGVVGSSGSLTVAAGATVAADGAVMLDATADVAFGGDLELQDGDLAIGASQINLGAVPVDAVGFNLDQAQLSELAQSVDNLSLRSRGDINLYDAVVLDANNLTLDAGAIVARSGADDVVSSISADTVTFTNSTGASLPVLPDQSHGSLDVSARDIEIGAGQSRIAGFRDVALSADNAILGRDAGALEVTASTSTAEAADLSLTAGVVGGHAGATTRIEASGAVSIDRAAATGVLPEAALGVDLRIAGSSIRHAGRIVAEAGHIAFTASGPGGVTVASGAVVDAGGAVREFDSTRAFAPGGVVELHAATGSVIVETDALLDVSGATAGNAGGAAGAVRLSAPRGGIRVDGRLEGRAVDTQRQGSVALDAAGIDDLDALNGRLNAGGFTATRSIRVREGDVALTGAVIADRIDIVVDGANGTGGALGIGGLLDARGSDGGRIRLAARGDLTVSSGARLLASASADDGSGGTVELMSDTGGVRLLSGGVVDTSGSSADGDGSVRLRVGRDVLEQFTADPGGGRMALDGTILGARQTIVEGVKTYLDADGFVTSDQVAAFASDAFFEADTFAQSAAAIAAALGRAGDSDFHVRPGIEIRSEGDLTLASTWDLFDWRFNGEPGYLTLRAAGNLTVAEDLTDGVSANYFAFLEQPAQDSWSYRLTAGADLGSASPFEVRDDASSGSLVLAANAFGSQRVIRTGTGDIEITAARDVRLTDQTSVIYTVGRPVTDISFEVKDFIEFQAINSPGFALGERGGDIVIEAGGDIVGAPTRQLVTDWLWRAGSESTYDNPSPTMWAAEYTRFRSGVGALAGGDVSIVAGGTIENVSAATSTVGVPLGASQFDNSVDVRGGGDLLVQAGGDIGGGVYFVGRGNGRLDAGGDIRAGTGWTVQGRSLHTALALGDAQFALSARGDLAIETVFNPTVLSPSPGQALIGDFSWLVDFVTYGDSSAVAATSVAGDVLFGGDAKGLYDYAKSFDGIGLDNDRGFNPSQAMRYLPPELRLVALTGDIVNGTAGVIDDAQPWTLSPSPRGQLELLAQGSVTFNNNFGYSISDADPSFFPTALEPSLLRPNAPGFKNMLNLVSRTGSLVHAEIPVHSVAYAERVGFTGERRPSLVVARSGDVTMVGGVALYSAEPIRLVAGRDIINPAVLVQNVEATDVTTLVAGRDIRYPLLRRSDRSIVAFSGSEPRFTVDGPGELLLIAGRDIDLKAAPGIVTRGNSVNPSLSDGGAGITTLVGTGAEPPAYDSFTDKYLAGRDDYRDELADFMRQRGVEGSLAQLVAAFKALPREQQLPLLSRILFAELRAVGRKAVAEGTGDYDAGYEAIETLFPHIDPEKMHTGDLSLFFSRIYTLDGGDIRAIVPAGVLNAGLAAAPEAFGVNKTPSELGMVVQKTGDVSILTGQDTLVNQSRIFAADGGSILIWSSAGNIDAGRGAKTAISAPPPVITYDADGNVTVEYKQALSGSGIRAFVTTEGRKPGDVDLFAPTGVILVNDAGIGTAGNLTVGATQVLGADNIDVGGSAVGVPVDTGALGASLAVVTSTTATTSSSAMADEESKQEQAPVAQAALSWLEVFVLGLGEENCRQDDIECLKRARLSNQ